MKISIAAFLIGCAAISTGCSEKYDPAERSWSYHRSEDRLRGLTIIEASRPSIEGQGEYTGMPLAFLGLSLDSKNMGSAKVSAGDMNALCLPGTTYLLRIDNDPIEERECTATARGMVQVFDAPTMNRIMGAEEVVLETTSLAGRRQMSFEMEGLAFDFESGT